MATAHTYTKFGVSAIEKLANLNTDALKVMLLSAYTPGQDTHQFLSDVLGAGTETSGTGYTAGGQTLTSVAISTSGHVVTMTCANPAWTGTFSCAYAVFYDSTPGSSATDPVFVYWDFGGTVTPTATTFTLAINASGLLTLTGS